MAKNVKRAANNKEGPTPHLIGSVDAPTRKSPLMSSTSFITSLDEITNIALRKRMTVKYTSPPLRAG